MGLLPGNSLGGDPTTFDRRETVSDGIVIITTTANQPPATSLELSGYVEPD